MEKRDGALGPYVLGLDIGVASVGWAIVTLDGEETPKGIADMGVRIFEAGVEGDIEAGKESSRAATRRQKRLARRQFWRRARRLGALFRLLQSHGLLPPGEAHSPQQRHELLLELDKELRVRRLPKGDRIAFHLLPYRLRALALSERLEPFEVGRALYHLAQRRGFKSNRKDTAKDRPPDEAERSKGRSAKKESTNVDEEPSPREVKERIAQLEEELKRTGLTLGAYLNTLDPEQAHVRRRFTSRKMHEEEFDAIWRAQAAYHPAILTDAVKARVWRAVFFQRPLRSAAHLIGHCDLEPNRRRAPMALPVAQRFRLLAAVNNLEVSEPSGRTRALSDDERSRLLDALSGQVSLKFDDARKLLGFKKPKERKDKATGQVVLREAGHTFNLERGGEKKLPGDRTAALLCPILGSRWGEFSQARKTEVVLDILSFHATDALKRHAMRAWGLDESSAARLAEVHIEDTRSRHCRPALEKLVARMEQGIPYGQARGELYPESFKAQQALPSLPPVLEVAAFRDFRNPAVIRVLTEVRKVVNHLIGRYGKPTSIRVEIARELKKPSFQRERQAKAMRDRQGQRDRAADNLRKYTAIQNATRDDKEKVLLADECNWTCPYTGRQISWDALFGRSPAFDVEHILPRKYLDNSFANKTLCDSTFNRQRKKDRLPLACFDPDGQEWHEVMERVNRFNGPLRAEKLRRFRLAEVEDDFVDRQFNDTASASRWSAEYVGLLYGGKSDANGVQRVFSVAGGVTGLLRAQWDLNKMLNEMPDAPRLPDASTLPLNRKRRCDHRHHAVDALVVALTAQGIVGELSAAAGDAGQRSLRKFQIGLPWADFWQDAFDATTRIVVSHRPDRRLAGPLHAETIYSRPLPAGVGPTAHRVRYPLNKLKPAHFAPVPPNEPITSGVADRAVRDAIRDKCGQADPAKLFHSPQTMPPEKLPCLVSKAGRRIPIRKARVIVNNKPIRVGEKDYRRRYVDSGSDTLHHTCIVAERDRRGRERWVDHAVSRLDVRTRAAANSPVVQAQWGANARLVMWLCKNDMIEMDLDAADPGKGRSLYVVRGVSEKDITLRLHHDARDVRQLAKAGDRSMSRIRSADEFRKRRARKVTISPLGEVSGADEPPAGPGGT